MTLITLHDYLPSQNAYKIRLLLSHLQQPYETKMVSIFEGEGNTDTFRIISPAATVPAITLSDGRSLAESNAILMYLAEGTFYLPDDAFEIAKIFQWLCFEAEIVQASVATLRHWVLTGKDKNRSLEILEAKKALSMKVLGILDRELRKNNFLVSDCYTIADISVFAYIHLAEDANLPLHRFTGIVNWIERIKGQCGFLAENYPYSMDPYSDRGLV